MQRGVEPEAAATIFGQVDHGNRAHLFGRLSDMVAAKLEQSPVVLSFDDVHWSDESSASALHFVARSNADRPLLGLLAARTDELRDNTAVSRALRELRQANLLEEIRLGPLPREALRELIDAHAPSAHAERLSADCGGNPCSQSSSRAPKWPATAARRSASSCRSGSRVSKATTATCCAGPQYSRHGSMPKHWRA
jgi:hypothetical protein